MIFFSIFERFKQLSARKTKLKAILKTGFYDINFLEIFVAQIIFDATYSKIERIYVNQWLGFTASLCILKYPAININASAVKPVVVEDTIWVTAVIYRTFNTKLKCLTRQVVVNERFQCTSSIRKNKQQQFNSSTINQLIHSTFHNNQKCGHDSKRLLAAFKNYFSMNISFTCWNERLV